MPKTKTKISSLGTVRTFLKVGTCSETLCNVLDRAFDNPLKPEEHAAFPFAGGIMQHGYQCGLIWGVALAAGAQAYQVHGSGPKAEAAALLATQRLVDTFHSNYKEINCLELTNTDWKKSAQAFRYFIMGGTIKCFRMAARFAPLAFSEINQTLSNEHLEAPSSPVSCAALLLQKMNASDKHTVMAAGFGGGIGLCGGACGALGAALWFTGIIRSEEHEGKVEFKDASAISMTENFLKCTDYKFECSEIVDRKFDNVGDHSDYLREGGCSKLIEVLEAELEII